MLTDSIKDVDQGLATAFASKTLPSSGDTVNVFVEAPATAGQRTREFPAISIMLIGEIEDPDRLEGDADSFKESEDIMVSPRVSKMRTMPVPTRLLYQIDTWVKDRARDDREIQDLVRSVLGWRGTVTVNGAPAWVFRTGYSPQDYNEGEVPIYRKTYTYEVLVEMAPTTLTDVKQAEEFRLSFKKGDHVEGADLEDSDDLALDLALVITTG